MPLVNGIYDFESVKLVNTREFSRSAQHFKKHGVYTKAHPIYDKDEFLEFWREEKRRRIEGYSVGGVKISGEYYGFLNYAPIFRTISEDDKIDGTEKEGAQFLSGKRKVAKKSIDFADFWDGHYHLSTSMQVARDNGLHFVGGKSRRKGFSYYNGWAAADKIDLYPRVTTAVGAFDTKYLSRGDGIMMMAKGYLDFLGKHTAWTKRRLVNTKEEIKLGYKLRGRDEEYGYLSKLLALTFKDNPDAAVGKDLYELSLDELNTFPNVQDVLDMTIPAMEDGGYITGQIKAWGTGGSKEGNWEAFQKLYYNPLEYGFMAFKNVWDGNMEHDSCGLFFPYRQNLVPFMDNDGNSDFAAADLYIESLREEKRKVMTPTKYSKWVAQRANSGKEAFGRSGDNIFIRPELLDWETKLSSGVFDKQLRCGQFVQGEKGIRFMPNEVLRELGKVHPPIDTYPLDPKADNHGCYVEYEPFFRDENGNIPANLYRVWADPYAFDKDKKTLTSTTSLGSFYIYERPNTFTKTKGGILMGEFVGRPERVDDFNRIYFDAIVACNGIGMFENDRGTIKDYAMKHRLMNLLADEPDLQFKKEIMGKHSRGKGVSMSNFNRKATAAEYLRDWIYERVGADSFGNDKLRIHQIPSKGLMREFIKWSMEGNFDRVSALLVGMLDDQELLYKRLKIKQVVVNKNSYFNRVLFK